MPWANSKGIVYNTWKPTSKQPKCILSRFLGFLSCSQDLEGLNQEESLSVMDCPGGRSRHRHDRCTLEDQAILSVLGTAIARPHYDGPSHAAFLVTFQVINAQQRNSPRKTRLQATGAFSLSLSALGRGCAPNLPWVRDPFFSVLCLWDSSRIITCPQNLSSSWLNETGSCFLKSWLCLFVSFALPTLGSYEEYPSRCAVPRDPIYPYGLSSPEERIISHILQTMLLFRYLGRIFTV